jgi:HEAT repeat protein
LVRAAGDPPDPTLLDLALEIINPAVASRIVQRIGHERDEERIAEYRVLCRRLGEIMARAFRGALTGATEREARRKYYDMLIAMSDTCRPIIEGMVEDENTLLVRSGIAVLGEIGGERALELVTSGLAHPDKRVRAEALLSLATLGDGESAALVMASLDDPERDVRVAAATAAGELRIERALRPLLAQLEDAGDGGDAVPFIDALGKLGDPGAVPAIEKHAVKTLFSKPPTEVRVAAYRALHRIGTPHARELVQKALEAKEPGVWVAVRQLVDAEPES